MDTIPGLSRRKESVFACVQDGHCHDAAVLKEAADMEVEEERHCRCCLVVSLVLKKREVSASFLTIVVRSDLART